MNKKRKIRVLIIEELLTLAHSKHEEIKTTPLDMASIVAQAEQALAFLIRERGALIQKPKTWPIARGYAPWVQEVWVNYLSNALKYGGNPPQITLGWTPHEGKMGLWVDDNGPGTSQAQLAYMFPPPSREVSPSTSHGLGLSIVQRIIQKLNGEVSVESAPGQGCTFKFTLPLVSV